MKRLALGLLAVAFLAGSAGAVKVGPNGTVQWDAVTTNSDGTPIFDLEGYLVYVGLSPALVRQADGGNYTLATTSTTASLGDLGMSEGLNYWVNVTAVDDVGNESAFSPDGPVQVNWDGTAPATPLKITVETIVKILFR